jgi:hypothetical protein
MRRPGAGMLAGDARAGTARLLAAGPPAAKLVLRGHRDASGLRPGGGHGLRPAVSPRIADGR